MPADIQNDSMASSSEGLHCPSATACVMGNVTRRVLPRSKNPPSLQPFMAAGIAFAT
jgi:hypothetical protein